VATRKNTVQLWDLVALRAGLARLGLDWDSSGLASSPKDSTVRLVRVASDTTPTAAGRAEGRARRELGLALRRGGRRDEAIRAFRDAVRLDRDDALAALYLGQTLREQGKTDEAILALREAVRREGTRPGQSSLDLAQVLRDTRRYDDAVEPYRAFLRDNPNDARTQTDLGLTLRTQGKLDEAIESLGAAARIDGTTVGTALPHLGVTLLQAGRYNEAITALRDLVERKPNDQARYSLGEALLRAGRPEEASRAFRALAEEYQRIIEQKPDDANARQLHALAQLLAGDRDDYRRSCIEMRDRFAASNPVDRGRVVRCSAVIPDAVPDPGALVVIGRSAAEALGTDRNIRWVLYALGLAQIRAGQFEEALRSAQRSLQLSPDWEGGALNRLVLALGSAGLGRSAEARLWLQTTDVLAGLSRPEGPPAELPVAQWTYWENRADFLLLRREAEERIVAGPGLKRP
jgi:tetratricopeptide (TPR) repeat protein